MMKHAMAIAGLAGCLISVGLAGTEPLAVPVADKAPIMDGVLDDAAWQKALKIEQLYLHNTDKPVKDTTVYLARDKKWLYIGFKCVNSNMAHVVQTVFKHDDLYPNFYANESVEVYIKPEDAKDRYYWFVLSAANVTFEQRLQAPPIFKRDIGWKAPWRSVTKRLPNGWTAEVAIPLYALECDDLGGAKINIVRNYRAIEFDQMGAKQDEKTVLSALKVSSRPKTHDFKSFVAISGLGGSKPEIPFAPRITAAKVTGLWEKDGQYFYDVKMTLSRFTPVAGKAKVQILEDMGAGDLEKLSELVDLDEKRELVLSVPAGDLRERKVRVALVDPADGNMLAVRTIDTSAISVIKKAFVGRSYYTSENAATIRLELGLPEAMLKQAVLVIDVNGKKVSETKGLKAVMIAKTAKIPLSALKIGANALTLRVILDGKELASSKLVVQRLEPRPGFEVKTDFIKGVMLKDDQPVFPVGIVVPKSIVDVTFPDRGFKDCGERLFKFLKDVGFTTLVSSHSPKDPSLWQAAITHADMFTKLANKYGMNVVEWVVPGPKPQGYIPGKPRPPITQPLAERLAFQKERYKKQEPALIENTRILREHRNMLAYWNVDEPNLGDRDVRIALAEWYWNTVQAIDPYRPQFLLYSKYIPRGDNWTRWGQILGYDVYPRPFMPILQGEPGLSTAYYAYELRERCRQDNKIMWFVPLANNLGPTRSPIGMNKAHMLCQAYTAIIYGSRGLLYFGLHITVGEDAWDALKTINAQIKVLAPALVNGDIAQHISYTPDNFRPRERKFPMVNAAVFQYPDGDYLLMAVNITPFAVVTKFKIAGIKKGIRLFDDNFSGKWKFDGEIIMDKIEGYGVRAYRLKLADNPDPVQVALDMTAVEDEKAPSVDLSGIVRQVMLGKNHVPNPCFKQQFNKGIPDFYNPYFNGVFDFDAGKKGSSWYVDNEMLWNGHPSLRMSRGKAGSEKTRGTWGTWGSWYPPASDKPVKMTFSFYAKCDKAGQRLFVRIFAKSMLSSDNDKRIPLTTEWKRYSITGEVSPGAGSNMGGRKFLFCGPSDTTVWISGLQMEAGDKPTEFQDDSVLVKKK